MSSDLSFANVVDSMELLQSDNELDSDFEEDEDVCESSLLSTVCEPTVGRL